MLKNNNGTTLTERSKVSLGLLVAIVGLGALLAGGFSATAWQARGALPREEAARDYVSKADYTRDRQELMAAINRLGDKQDQIRDLLIQHTEGRR